MAAGKCDACTRVLEKNSASPDEIVDAGPYGANADGAYMLIVVEAVDMRGCAVVIIGRKPDVDGTR